MVGGLFIVNQTCLKVVYHTGKAGGAFCQKLISRKNKFPISKVWLGILVVTDISLVGWLASNIASASTVLIATVVVAVVVATAGIVLLHRRIEQRIESLRGL